jgi:hypothetical protein
MGCAQALVLEAIHTAAYAGQSLGSPLLCPPRKLESVDAETLLDFKAKYLSTLTFPQGLHSPAGSLAALRIGSGIVRCGSSRHRCDATRMRRQVSRPVRWQLLGSVAHRDRRLGRESRRAGPSALSSAPSQTKQLRPAAELALCAALSLPACAVARRCAANTR